MHNQLLNEIRNLGIKKSELWIKEAEFGYRHIEPLIKKLPEGAKILEVGCGSGILLSCLSENFKKKKFTGLEPFGEGFSSLIELNKIIRSTGVQVENIAYEEYIPKKDFSLIYCINVFEHLEDWHRFLKKSLSWLNKDGRLIILCPNYGFPYESHFKIPVIFNKKITSQIFKQYIKNFELENDSIGLWNSLNFVKKKDVLNQLKKIKNIELLDDIEIIDDLISRVSDDEEFNKRQKFIGSFAKLIRSIGLLKLLKIFRNHLPYMKLDISFINK